MTRVPAFFGPTFSEMRDPSTQPEAVRKAALKAATDDPLNPINLFNITWKDAKGGVRHILLDEAVTGVEAPIAIMSGSAFPTGSHKVGATYSVLAEHMVRGTVDPKEHTVVWPSTGNYGIGGAYVGGRLGFKSVVVLPEEMSAERFETIRRYGADIIATPGCESNVKEIYDKCNELAGHTTGGFRIMNQFEQFANYRFHTNVTGTAACDLAASLGEKGVGDGSVAAFVSSMGSAGTIGAGDTMKERFGRTKIVGLEPVQCPTLFENGFGGHEIQGIGDKHVTWIHNVANMDLLACIDDHECLDGLEMFISQAGQKMLRDAGVPEATVAQLASLLGISGVCNLLGAIKTAKYYRFGKKDLIVTVATDTLSRYVTMMNARNTARGGEIDAREAEARHRFLIKGQKLDWIEEGTRFARDRWLNLKYFTWVEQQGKTPDELRAQRSQDYWAAKRAETQEIDKLIAQHRTVPAEFK